MGVVPVRDPLLRVDFICKTTRTVHITQAPQSSDNCKSSAQCTVLYHFKRQLFKQQLLCMVALTMGPLCCTYCAVSEGIHVSPCIPAAPTADLEAHYNRVTSHPSVSLNKCFDFQAHSRKETLLYKLHPLNGIPQLVVDPMEHDQARNLPHFTWQMEESSMWVPNH